jgi:hypothetical protein
MNRCYLMFLMQYPLSWAFVVNSEQVFGDT